MPRPYTPAPSYAADSDLADEYDDALAEHAYTATSRDGVRWHIQPRRHDVAAAYKLNFPDHSLICVEQYNAPDEIGCYEPVGIASGRDEALDMISHDYHRRSAENGDLCPEGYALWTRDEHGHYRRTAEITPN